MLDSKKLKLVTLAENTAKWLWLLGEWGWSMLVEADGKRILFDTGLRMSVVNNASMMGIDITTIDCLALSHGHMDHTGGLWEVLERIGASTGHSIFLHRHKSPIEITAHPDIWDLKYIKHPGDKEYSFGGLPFRKEALMERQGVKFNESRKPVWLTDDIVWSGEIPRVNDFEEIAPICFVKKNPKGKIDDDSNFETDPLNDDAALYIKTDVGLVIVLGCGHHGLINTIHHAQKLTGIEKVHTVVGGTHLVDASENQLERTIKELKRLEISRLGVSHCTGDTPTARLAEALGKDSFFYNHAGNVVEFD